MSVLKKWRCSFYEDSEGTVPINTINLGSVGEGEEQEKTVYIRNDEGYLIKDMSFNIDNNDVEIVAPTSLSSMEVAPLTIRWNPKIDSIKLDTDIIINGVMVV